MHHPFLIGPKVYLRGMEAGDLDGPCFQWLNDPHSDHGFVDASWPNSDKKMRALFERISDSRQDLVLSIFHCDSERHVGLVTLKDVDWVHRHARMTVLIGEEDMRGQGLGSEALQLLAGHALSRLNLHRVWMALRQDNLPALRAAAKAGFQEEGRARQALFCAGQFHDLIHLSRLAGA